MSLLLPTDFTAFTGVDIPDPVTFVVGEHWLNRPMLYPRQATVVKLVFLRTDLLTDYDHQVIDEWEESFRRTGNRGIVPDIRQRADQLREMGYQHFREVLLVLGRRAGKGYLCALLMAYVIWQYMALGDPQGYYGIDRDKQLAAFLYAGKKQQARVNLWQDLVHIIQGSECFQPYISRSQGESLTIYAPYDLVRMNKLAHRGFQTTMDQATFLIEPKEATMMSGRGPASCIQGYDEMAHMVTAGGASRSAEEVWNAATPSLDQFRKDAFIVEPSSPWQMIGQFYQNWLNSLLLDEDGVPAYPNIFMLQLESWDIYQDWELAHVLPLFPHDFEGDLKEYQGNPHPKLEKLKGAVQTYDSEMQKLEMANPETFAVERRSHWQSVVDAYLDPKKIEAMFNPALEMKTEGTLSMFYKGHADPSTVNANYGVVIGHPETRDGIIHAVIDHVHFWRPSDFPDNIIDYIMVDESLWKLIYGFKCDEFTFDQYNSAGSIQRLQQHVRESQVPKRMQIYELTATAAHNWERAENFKVALNQGWIECPPHEQLQLELKFLQRKDTATTHRVDKQDTGPVTTKDIADCIMEVVWTLLGDQVHSYTHGALSNFQLQVGLQGGINPHAREMSAADSHTFDQLGGLSGRQRNAVMRGGGLNAARNAYRRRS
jgi:hypothetical protein